MNKKDVMNHFRGPRDLAERIGVTTQYVSQWGKLIPEAMAARIDKLTGGKLLYDPEIYIEEQRKRRMRT